MRSSEARTCGFASTAIPERTRSALEFIETGVIRSREFVDGESSLTNLPTLLKSMTSGNQAVKTLIRVHE